MTELKLSFGESIHDVFDAVQSAQKRPARVSSTLIGIDLSCCDRRRVMAPLGRTGGPVRAAQSLFRAPRQSIKLVEWLERSWSPVRQMDGSLFCSLVACSSKYHFIPPRLQLHTPGSVHCFDREGCPLVNAARRSCIILQPFTYRVTFPSINSGSIAAGSISDLGCGEAPAASPNHLHLTTSKPPPLFYSFRPFLRR